MDRLVALRSQSNSFAVIEQMSSWVPAARLIRHRWSLDEKLARVECQSVEFYFAEIMVWTRRLNWSSYI